MSKLPQEERDALLADLSQMGSRGRAEDESSQTFRQTFFPVAEHVRAFDPDVVLIVGERGSGKSELFRAVVKEDLLDSILRRTPGSRPSKVTFREAKWLAGYPLGKDFPDYAGLRRFIGAHADDPEAVPNLWFAYLLRVLCNWLPGDGPLKASGLLNPPGGDVDGVLAAFRSAGNEPLILLDRLDSQLESSDRWVFVSYDELDILGSYDWDAMVRGIKGLVSFWASHSRRWSRIRAKLFLRTDLFRHHWQALGADLSKLAANRAEISWSDRNLYGMLAKRIVNSSAALERYCRKSRLKFETDTDLGLVPVLEKAEDASPLVDQLVGKYMGANNKKGSTFRWLLSHVRDGNGRAMPRALVRLIEEAAQQERDVPRAVHSRLLAPASLRRALDTVSREHVFQANTHELPWLPGVAKRLKGEGAPMSSRRAEYALGRDWDEDWSNEGLSVRPPVEKPSQLIDYLVEIGVFRLRSGGRIDVPDLFLAGLGMTRKGGVARK
ncbi:MAG: hypothetical protein ACE141_00830 [Bryobacteraceae bacterium]